VEFIDSVDQLGNSIHISFPPKRIVSLVPSQTELLFDLGLSERIVGVTRFCRHPVNIVNTIDKIGGSKHFDTDKIAALNPDLIIGNKEENDKESIALLAEKYPVWVSDIYNISDAYEMIIEIGRITGRGAESEQLTQQIKDAFNQFKVSVSGTCAYFISRKPYMVAASGTFIDYLISVLGLSNVFAGLQRYPEIDINTLQHVNPDYIFLSSEPYSFSEKHLDEFKQYAPGAKVLLVDGEMFSWYGSRLRLAPAYFNSLISNMRL
jgi:ABC-type Fe3+-hydroxamate transport system substrate-binding protein